MKRVKLLVEDSSSESRKDDITDMYLTVELKGIPNISPKELDACEYVAEHSKHDIVGFVRSDDYTKEHPDFIQVYAGDIEILYEDYII